MISFMACWIALDTSGSSILETTSKLLSGMSYESVRNTGVRMRTTGSSGAGAGWDLDGSDGAGDTRGAADAAATFVSAALAGGGAAVRASASSAMTTLSVMFSIMVISDASSARITAARTCSRSTGRRAAGWGGDGAGV